MSPDENRDSSLPLRQCHVETFIPAHFKRQGRVSQSTIRHSPLPGSYQTSSQRTATEESFSCLRDAVHEICIIGKTTKRCHLHVGLFYKFRGAAWRLGRLYFGLLCPPVSKRVIEERRKGDDPRRQKNGPGIRFHQSSVIQSMHSVGLSISDTRGAV